MSPTCPARPSNACLYTGDLVRGHHHDNVWIVVVVTIAVILGLCLIAYSLHVGRHA